MYYEFVGHRVVPGFPKPLTNLGLPEWLERVTVAFVWDYNDKTYLFSGEDYWRFDENEGHVELDYPRKIESNWHGIPVDVDGAFVDHHSKSRCFAPVRLCPLQNAHCSSTRIKFITSEGCS